MANRLAESGGFGLTDVLTAYYGRGTPTGTALALASVLALRPQALADGKYLYAYSDQDCTTQGWRTGDQTIQGSEAKSGDFAGLTLHLSRAFPGAAP